MIRNRTLLSLSALAVLTACAAPVSPPVAAPAPATTAVAGTAGATLHEAAAAITPASVYARVEFLAADEMRGRDTPSPELEIAANYLRTQARLYGLEPGAGDSYFQRWPFPLRRLGAAAARLEIAGVAGTQNLVLGRDYFATGGTRDEITGGLVFAGRGGDAAMAEGAMRDNVLVFTLPGEWTAQMRGERARQLALARRSGAAAVIHVLDDSWTQDSIAQFAQLAGAPGRAIGGADPFLQVHLSRNAARRVFAGADLDLDALWASSQPEREPVALTGLTATAGLPVEVLDPGLVPNVVAVLRGSDPVLRDEYVVLSAHFDHVGVGTPVNGDSIYNGADDNASGTAALLEVARALTRMEERPRRSVIFLWVSGEEKGLLGSRWYSENPTVPLERIVANVNVDMIGGGGRDSVVVIGKDYSTLGDMVNRVNARHPELRLVASDDIWPEQRFFFRSDHFNFARKEVPAIFFFTGVHECYHRPCDQVERLDVDKASRITRLLLYYTWEIANAEERPRWDPAGLEEVRRLTR